MWLKWMGGCIRIEHRLFTPGLVVLLRRIIYTNLHPLWTESTMEVVYIASERVLMPID